MPNPSQDWQSALADLPPIEVRIEGVAVTGNCCLTAAHPMMLVGRGGQCDLLLKNNGVSRRHALLARWRDAVYVMDLGSRGGTRIGPRAQAYGWLARGAPVEIGPCRLSVDEGASDRERQPFLHRDLLPSDRDCDWQLEFVSGDVRPATYVLRRPLTLVGRKPPCKIQLRLKTIQSVHAALLVTSDGLYVRDVSGRCALQLDGQSVLGGWPQDGQTIELGNVRIRVTQISPVVAPQQSEADTEDPTGSATNEAIVPLRSSVKSSPDIEVTTGESPTAEGQTPPGGLGNASPTSSPEGSSRTSSYTGVVLGGRYQISEKLARGGMGVVYKGLDTRLHRTVAVKVVRGAGKAEKHPRRRLLREAMVCSRFDHPSIVRILDVDKQGRFAVFEYVSGETLADRLRRDGRITADEAAVWMAHVADAIEHAAGNGVVHRDIKPANVLIAPGGIAKLVDFGLSHIADAGDSKMLAKLTEKTERPRPGIAVGTAPYAAPEQFADSQQVDTRSDIYSAGCTLFTLLAGKTPFSGGVAEMYRQHREEPVPEIPGLSAAISAIVQKCLAKSPEDRYQTGAELAAALRALTD